MDMKFVLALRYTTRFKYTPNIYLGIKIANTKHLNEPGQLVNFSLPSCCSIKDRPEWHSSALEMRGDIQCTHLYRFYDGNYKWTNLYKELCQANWKRGLYPVSCFTTQGHLLSLLEFKVCSFGKLSVCETWTYSRIIPDYVTGYSTCPDKSNNVVTNLNSYGTWCSILYIPYTYMWYTFDNIWNLNPIYSASLFRAIVIHLKQVLLGEMYYYLLM